MSLTSTTYIDTENLNTVDVTQCMCTRLSSTTFRHPPNKYIITKLTLTYMYYGNLLVSVSLPLNKYIQPYIYIVYLVDNAHSTNTYPIITEEMTKDII